MSKQLPHAPSASTCLVILFSNLVGHPALDTYTASLHHRPLDTEHNLKMIFLVSQRDGSNSGSQNMFF